MTRLRSGWPGLDSRQGQDIFLFAAAYISGLGITQPPINVYRGQYGWVVKLVTPFSVVVKIARSLPPLSYTSSWSGV